MGAGPLGIVLGDGGGSGPERESERELRMDTDRGEVGEGRSLKTRGELLRRAAGETLHTQIKTHPYTHIHTHYKQNKNFTPAPQALWGTEEVGGSQSMGGDSSMRVCVSVRAHVCVCACVRALVCVYMQTCARMCFGNAKGIEPRAARTQPAGNDPQTD